MKPLLEQNMIWQTNTSSPSVVELAVLEIILGIQIQTQTFYTVLTPQKQITHY